MKFLLIVMLLLCTEHLTAQSGDSTSLVNKIANFPNRLFDKIRNKTAGLDRQLDRQTEKYLQKLARREEKLKKKLLAYDSNASKYLFNGNTAQQYAQLAQKIKADSAIQGREYGGEYMPYVDSLQGTLKFLNANPQLINSSQALPADIQNTLAQLQLLQARLQNADQVKAFIRQRRDRLKQYLAQYAQLPPGIKNLYDNYNKQLYYYSEQVREYKAMLNDPDKMMKKALELLNNVPAFTAFMKSNSMLAGLFGISSDYGSADAISGLQTRDQVLSIIQNQISSGGPNAASALSQNLQSAQSELNTFKDKL
ncbi:MAG: hypothetical protein ABUT20_59310, partial [Bacteroidota bacterium]